MLQEMRKYTKSWVSSVFLGLLAVSFGIWGIADIFRGSTDTSAFTLGSVEVPIDEFTRDYRNATREMAATLTPDLAKQYGKQILDQMALRTALDIQVKRLGLTASDGRVQQQIQSISAFNGFLGKFDHPTFLQKIEKVGYTEDQFIARTRTDLARSQMIQAVEGGLELPPGYGNAVYAYINEQRAVQYFVLTPETVPAIAPPPDAVLAAYVKAHPKLFSSPEYRSIELATVKLDDVASKQAVSDKDIQAEIDANQALYVTPERRTLEQLTFKSEDEAKAAKAEIDGGKPFDAVAAERKVAASDYQLGDVAAADLDPARSTAFFALAQNQVSAPVKSTFGWVLMHVTKITPGKTTSNDDVRKSIQKRLAADKVSDISSAYTNAVGAGDSIDDAARKAGMTVVHIAAVDAKGLAPDGSKAVDPADPELLAAVFKADPGEDGDAFATQTGDLYAVKVNDVTPPALKPLDKVRAQALALWTDEQKQIALMVRAKALAARANAEHALTGAATAAGSPPSASPALTRATNTGLFSADVVKAVFDAPPGATIVIPSDGRVIVARISGIAHPPPQAGDLNYIRLIREVSSEVSGDVSITLAKAIEKAEGLKVNQKMIDNAVGNTGS